MNDIQSKFEINKTKKKKRKPTLRSDEIFIIFEFFFIIYV